MRVASLVEEVQSAQDKRSALYQSYDDAIDKFKAGKDHSNFMSQRKKIDGDYKQLTSQIQNLQGQLKSEGSDLGEKVCLIVSFSTLSWMIWKFFKMRNASIDIYIYIYITIVHYKLGSCILLTSLSLV